VGPNPKLDMPWSSLNKTKQIEKERRKLKICCLGSNKIFCRACRKTKLYNINKDCFAALGLQAEEIQFFCRPQSSNRGQRGP
jgi:hypothetical protein